VYLKRITAKNNYQKRAKLETHYKNKT